MTYGIRLSGTTRDLAALRTLVDMCEALVVGPWTTFTAPAPSTASVIVHRNLDASLARHLRARGVDVVRVTRTTRGASFAGAKGAPEERYEPCRPREASTLAEAIPPVRVHGAPPCREALLLAAISEGAAQRTLERLLALGRDDVTLTELDDGAHRALLLRVPSPPMYILLRARDEPAEGVTAFAPTGDSSLWVEWSWTHPFAHIPSQQRLPDATIALVSRDGRWRTLAARLPARSVYDGIVPRFEGIRHTLLPAPGETRFTIRLRLAPAPPSDPELWLLDPEQFLALEALVESLPPEALARFPVTRNTTAEGIRYVLQEHPRPGQPRLGTRVSELTATRGFSRALGTDNLYLPPDRQFLPRMRRDELRALFSLDGAPLVLVDEDHDGPRIFTVYNLDASPLSRWVDYVATDRRTTLERLEESSVFEWPELQVEPPPRRHGPDTPAQPRGPAPPKFSLPSSPAEPPPPAPPAPALSTELPPPSEDTALAQLREEARDIALGLSRGGVDDPTPWRELAWRKRRLGESDDAAACLESLMFFEGPSLEACEALATLRHVPSQGSTAPDDPTSLLARERLSPVEATWLAARVVASVLRGDPTLGERSYQEAARRFAAPETPVSRRLAWVVCRTLHARTNDRIGLTRARERLLGALNEQGLSRQLDLPRFVRLTLALQGNDSVPVSARDDPIAALETLRDALPRAAERGLDSLPVYLTVLLAVGFARLGDDARGRQLLHTVDGALAALDPPNRTLLGLYRARYVHTTTQRPPEAWKAEVDAALSALREPRVRDRVEWLRKRSEWLRSGTVDSVGSVLKPTVERALTEAEAHPERALDTLSSLLDNRALFDFEVRIVAQRLLRVGMRRGDDALLAPLLQTTRARLDRLSHPGHRAELLGECLRAAAVLHDTAAVEALLDGLVAMVHAPNAPATRDLLMAVTPALAALRRLGAGAATQHFLDALVPCAERGNREGIRLRAALAEGFLLLRDTARADALLDEALEDTFTEGLDHVGRYEAGAAVLGALRHWPVHARAPRCRRVFESLGRFTDAFTASTQRVYETHKILIAERVVDALADTVTLADDRASAWLAEEEQVTRRRILADWRDACGR